MKLTTPDNLPYPEPGDDLNPLDEWFADLAAATQKALLATGPDLADTPWVYPSLLNNWKNSTDQPMRYRRFMGNTWVQGFVSGGTVTPIFILPEGFRPSQPIRLPSVTGTGSSSAFTTVPVGADGVIAAAVGSAPNVNLSWPAER